MLWLLTPTVHNFPQALKLSTNFLSAQRVTSSPLLNNASTLPAWQQLPAAAGGAYPWLSGSVPTGNDADLVQGGFYMSGDYVKQTFPLATSMAMLAWSMMAFNTGYEKVSHDHGSLQQLTDKACPRLLRASLLSKQAGRRWYYASGILGCRRCEQ